MKIHKKFELPIQYLLCDFGKTKLCNGFICTCRNFSPKKIHLWANSPILLTHIYEHIFLFFYSPKAYIAKKLFAFYVHVGLLPKKKHIFEHMCHEQSVLLQIGLRYLHEILYDVFFIYRAIVTQISWEYIFKMSVIKKIQKIRFYTPYSNIVSNFKWQLLLALQAIILKK